MQKKSIWILIAVVIVLAVGGFLIFHKSPKPTNASSGSTTNSNVVAVNNSVVITKTDATLGQYLADPSGRTLYTYGSDSSGVSNCTGGCLASWPAYQDKGSATGLPAGISTIKRTDNSQVQYTYNGMPLYYFASDSPGQATGNGVSGFTLAKPAAASSSKPTTTTPSSSSSSSSNSSSSYPY